MATGPYCWRLANGRLLAEPIPYKGTLHIYELPEEISSNIHQQLSKKPKPHGQSVDAWITALAPDPIETGFQRCQSYGQALNDLQGAVRAAGKMIRLRPESPIGYRLRGLGHLCNGNAVGAIADYLEAIRLDPNTAEDHFQLAVAYRAVGDEAKSISQWHQAKGLDPEMPGLD